MIKYEIEENVYGDKMVKWNDDGIIRFIPISSDNIDYQNYLKWLEENNG